MGKIIKNGIEYGGSTNEAVNINYDNSVSGLSANTVQNAIDETVAMYNATDQVMTYSPSNVSVPTATNTLVGSINFAQGTYILTIACAFTANDTGYRKAFLSSASDLSSDLGWNAQFRIGSCGSVTNTSDSLTYIFNTASSVTYYIGAYQNSGSTLTVTTRVRYVKLK